MVHIDSRAITSAMGHRWGCLNHLVPVIHRTPAQSVIHRTPSGQLLCLRVTARPVIHRTLFGQAPALTTWQNHK